MTHSPIHIVWFKRDLRLRDHRPLAEAIQGRVPTLLWYNFEPAVLRSRTFEVRHGRFIWESLQDLQDQLRPFGGQVWITYGNTWDILRELATHFEINGLFSHQETGEKHTYDRDLAVKAFCQQANIPWHEFPQDGVVRGLTNRETWERQWYTYMQGPLVQVDLKPWQAIALPKNLTKAFHSQGLPVEFQQTVPGFQPGGETFAWKYLDSFLRGRAKQYITHLSSPLLSRTSSSRLSPYLAYGCVSPRMVYQLTDQARKDRPWGKMFTHIHDRLWWRSHYMQKLETEWHIEFEPINRGMSALGRRLDEKKLAAFAQGKTGFPLIDACIRCLQANGYLNFRMRAMLATFASFGLNLPWQATAEVLARLFLDYEPGIHYPQIQMQAGMSGYHPLRIFHPTRQAEQHDSKGAFIHQYVPELAQIPAPDVFTPWHIPILAQQLYQCVIGKDYPSPIVPYDQAVEQAKTQYWEVRQRPATQRHLSRLWRKHCLPHNRAQYEAELQKEGWK